jgi:hypothetical protein
MAPVPHAGAEVTATFWAKLAGYRGTQLAGRWFLEYGRSIAEQLRIA